MILGVIGIVVPLLPTTPFLLLAAYCYARSSPRLLHWMLTNRWCGEYIRKYREGRGIPLRQKVITLGILWLTICYGALAVAEKLWLRGLLFGIAVAVSAHLLRVKTRESRAELLE